MSNFEADAIRDAIHRHVAPDKRDAFRRVFNGALAYERQAAINRIVDIVEQIGVTEQQGEQRDPYLAAVDDVLAAIRKETWQWL